MKMDCSSSTVSEASEKDTWNAEQSTNQQKPLTQLELNDLTRDLNLSKEFAHLLGSRLCENNLLTPSPTYFRYRNKMKSLEKNLNMTKIIPWYTVKIFQD